MADKLDVCPLCSGKVDSNVTPNYAECWCESCGLMLKQWGNDAGKKLVSRWNTRVLPECEPKVLSDGTEKCGCGKKLAGKEKFCPSCGKKIIRKG